MMAIIKNIFKFIARSLFGNYQLNRIYYKKINRHELQIPQSVDLKVIVNLEDIDQSKDQDIKDHKWYAMENAFGFGLWDNDDLVCMCWFWNNKNENLPNRFNKIGEQEVVMVDLITSKFYRGKGYALLITNYAENELGNSGYNKMWTWVWRSNKASARVFSKANWVYDYFLAELNLPLFSKPVKIRLPKM